MLDPERIKELKTAGRLPSPHGIALEIIRLTQNEHVTLQQLTRAIQSDPALTGRLLKAANSPIFGLRRSIVAIQDVVTLLGMPMVRQLALSFSLISDYKQNREVVEHPIQFDYQAYWQDSLLAGIAAQAIAAQMHLANSEELFVLGLLAQIGRLALASLHGSQYAILLKQNVDATAASLDQAEIAAFQISHGELTGILLQDWGIPRVLWLAVAAHEDLENTNLAPDSRELRMATALNLAWKLTHAIRVAKEQPVEKLRHVSTELIFTAAKIGIDSNRLIHMIDEILKNWKHWGQIMEIPIFEVPSLFLEEESKSEETLNPEIPKALPSASTMRILIADDDPSMVLIVQKILAKSGHIIAIARNGRDALDKIFKFNPEMLITDWLMPQLDGLQLVKALRETKQGQGIYVLFLTGIEQEEKLIEAFDAGIDDYILKPFVPRVLAARIRAGERFVRQRKELAQDLEEIRRFASELAVNNRKLQHAVMTDPLTGLPNRRYASERLMQEISLARRRAGTLSLIAVDVDYFTHVNDKYGHDVGDEVLRHVSGLLRGKARLQDAICRVGGEEFLIICPDTNSEEAMRCGERLRKAIAENPYHQGSLHIQLTASLGLVTVSSEIEVDELVKYADRAVYQAKAAGRNRIVVAAVEKE